jgi:hypothetical protein
MKDCFAIFAPITRPRIIAEVPNKAERGALSDRYKIARENESLLPETS